MLNGKEGRLLRRNNDKDVPDEIKKILETILTDFAW